MVYNSRIVVFNYAFDVSDPLLSHQYEAVKYFAAHFKEVVVITGRKGSFPPLENVKVYSTSWKSGKKFRSVYRLFKVSIPVLARRNYTSVFFHMTDVQAAILSPIIRILKKPQFLWYAHTMKSKYLTFSSFWVSNIVTSTSGSCPIHTTKVLPIGQSVDTSLFPFRKFDKRMLHKSIHVGRFDKSKRVDELISAVNDLRAEFDSLELMLVGSTANKDSKRWADGVVKESMPFVEAGWLKFKEAIPKNQFVGLVSSYGIFLHKYEGSLDKTLIEATMLGVPVVTTNPEYISIFGSWGGRGMPSIIHEYRTILKKDNNEIQQELARRSQIAISDHSLENWGKRMSEILSGNSISGFKQVEVK